MALTTIFLHSFETIVLILVLTTLFRIRKHYLLSSQSPPEIRQKPRQSKQIEKKCSKKALHSQIQTKYSSNHYFQTLPEPEVSISSDNEMDYAIDSVIEVSPTPPEVATKESELNKSILHNYIDIFFVDVPIDTCAVKEPEFIHYQAKPTSNI